MLEVGEVKPLGDVVVGEAAATEGGDAEGGREAVGGRRQRPKRFRMLGRNPALEHLEAVEGRGHEPAIQGGGGGGGEGGGHDPPIQGGGGGDGETVPLDTEAAAGALVAVKNVRYSRGDVVVDPAVSDDREIGGGGEATAVEVERGGEPEVAPPGREDLGAGAVLDGEEGDDLAEEFVGEGADPVDSCRPGRRFNLSLGAQSLPLLGWWTT